MTRTRSFKDLIVWQKSYKLGLIIYRVTKNFPKEEMYGLICQMRRAAVSVPSNIAEGYGRQYKAEYKRFLSIAYASLAELETQYLFSIGLKYVETNETVEGLIKEVGSMLYRMMNPRGENSV